MFRVSAKETALADRLRQEALASRPVFSEALHVRLCGALRQCQADAPRPRQRPPAIERFVRWAPAVAAACLLIAVCASWIAIKVRPEAGSDVSGLTDSSGLVARNTAPSLPKAPRKIDVRSMTKLVGQVTAQFDGMVNLAVTGPRRIYLDRNLRIALETPMVRVPLDVVSSLLSMGSQKHPQHLPPAGRPPLSKQGKPA